MMSGDDVDKTPVVLTLFFILVLLVLLLFYLYKRLNRDTKDQYTIQRLVFSEGGLRDRAIQGIAVVETRLGVRIRPQTPDEEEALGIDEDENGDKEEEDVSQGHGTDDSKGEERHDDSSDDYSSIDLQERVKQNNNKEEEKKEEEQEKEEVEKAEGKEDDSKKEEDVKNEERVGLLVDLTFSGSAIWSEEKKEETNVTAL